MKPAVHLDGCMREIPEFSGYAANGKLNEIGRVDGEGLEDRGYPSPHFNLVRNTSK